MITEREIKAAGLAKEIAQSAMLTDLATLNDLRHKLRQHAGVVPIIDPELLDAFSGFRAALERIKDRYEGKKS